MSYFDKELLDKLRKYNFAVYLRRSSQDGEDKQIKSIPGQVLDVEEQIINSYHLNVQRPYFEESQSAFKQGRYWFGEMSRQIEKGYIQGVIVWHSNRIARNYGDGGKFVQYLMDGKLKIIITCFGIYENTPRDLEYLMTEFTRATRDSGDKSDAVKRGNRTKFLEDKKWLGLAKPGFINVTNPITKENEVLVDEDRFRLISKAVRLVLDHTFTPMQARDKLNNEWGYRSRLTKKMGGKPMAKSGWYRLLTDPYLYGKLIRKEGEIMSKDRKMITQEEFDRLQIILGRKGKPQISKHEFAFKEVVRCGECGGSITCEEKWHVICSECHNFKFHRGKNTICCPQCKTDIEDMNPKKMKLLHYIHYHCTKRVNRNCTQGSIALDKLERQVDEAIDRFEIPETFKDWAIEHLNELNDIETDDREITRRNAQKAYNDCVTKLDNLFKLRISALNSDESLISDEDYSRQRKYFLSEKEAYLNNMNSTDNRINAWHELSAKAFNFACYARYWFKHGDLKTKTQILGALGSNLTILDKKVCIDGYKHFFLIEKGKQDVVAMAKMIEPEKWLDILTRIDVVEALKPQWLPG